MGRWMELKTLCNRDYRGFSDLIIEKEMEMKQHKDYELVSAGNGWWFSMHEWPRADCSHSQKSQPESGSKLLVAF